MNLTCKILRLRRVALATSTSPSHCDPCGAFYFIGKKLSYKIKIAPYYMSGANISMKIYNELSITFSSTHRHIRPIDLQLCTNVSYKQICLSYICICSPECNLMFISLLLLFNKIL